MAAGEFAPSQKRADWLVVALTALALVLGWGLKEAVTGLTKNVESGGIVAQFPAQWLVEKPESQPLAVKADPSLVLTSWNPLDPSTRYSVSLLPGGADANTAAAASLRNLQRAQSLMTYRVLEQTPVQLSGRDGYRVRFAFVDASIPDQPPVVFEGVDYFFEEGGQIIIVTLETSDPLEEALPAFRNFAAGVHVGGE